MSKKDTTEEILEIVTFMKDNMATKTELQELASDVGELKKDMKEVKEKITAVERSLTNRLDNELDKRGHLEARITKLEVARK